MSNLKFFIWGGYSVVNFGHLKSEVFHWGGGDGALWSEIPERGFLENLDKNLLFELTVQKPACASQIVSHTLCVWRLIRDMHVPLEEIMSEILGT